jgi:hypothetical protein
LPVRKLEPGEPVTLIGAPKLCVDLWLRLWECLALMPGVLDGEAMVLQGAGRDYTTAICRGRAVPA